ncbi:MAG: hypothetical protein R3305_11130, partial [Gammaproteobacteria bacterium]|nr:hypothetical protein [Gammaproteobacteria bacterium]
MADGAGWPALDFEPVDDGARIDAVEIDGAACDFELTNGHIVLASPSDGRHRVTIDFVAGNGALTRRD